MKGMVINSMELGLRQDGISLSGSVFGKKIEYGITRAAGAATVQILTFSGTGVIRLRWKGQETGDLDVATMSNTDLQTALRALPGIGSSTQLTVTGAGSPFTITFGNALGGPFEGDPQPILEVRTISGSPTATTAITTRGGYTDHEGQIVLPRHVEFFLSPTLAGLATSKESGVFSTGMNIGNRQEAVYDLDRSQESWFNTTEVEDLDITFGMIGQAQSNIMQYLQQARSDTPLYLRLLMTGATIGSTSFQHRMQIDCPVKIGNFGPFGSNQGVYAFEYLLKAFEDRATGNNLVITLDNAVSSY
jgi:hypothetical protein